MLLSIIVLKEKPSTAKRHAMVLLAIGVWVALPEECVSSSLLMTMAISIGLSSIASSFHDDFIRNPGVLIEEIVAGLYLYSLLTSMTIFAWNYDYSDSPATYFAVSQFYLLCVRVIVCDVVATLAAANVVRYWGATTKAMANSIGFLAKLALTSYTATGPCTAMTPKLVQGCLVVVMAQMAFFNNYSTINAVQ